MLKTSIEKKILRPLERDTEDLEEAPDLPIDGALNDGLSAP
jgi:hypothetical protein